MPVSRKRKKKHVRSSRTHRSGYVAKMVSDTTDDVVDRLLRMPPERLPSAGMAEWYLFSSPLRDANQCVAASVTVMMAMRSLGLQAEPVGLLLDVPTGRGETTRYGNEVPHIDGDFAIGHVGLIADDHFMDITAFQFPEVLAHGGVRVIANPLNGQSDVILERGAVMPTRLIGNFLVQYTVVSTRQSNIVIE